MFIKGGGNQFWEKRKGEHPGKHRTNGPKRGGEKRMENGEGIRIGGINTTTGGDYAKKEVEGQKKGKVFFRTGKNMRLRFQKLLNLANAGAKGKKGLVWKNKGGTKIR